MDQLCLLTKTCHKSSDHVLLIIILRLGSQELVGKIDEFNFKHTECELLM